MLAAGTVLDGKYEIRSRLGSGGMGEVYLARRVFLGDEVALKLIRHTGMDPETLHSRFLRESRACAQLRHPNIVSILDFNIDEEGHPYLVMEHLNGPSLAEELRARGRFDLAAVRSLVASLGSALQMAHARGIVHRDLKPPNIVSHRYESGEVLHKIIDFGLANVRGDEQAPLTAEHEFIGTVAYAAPEQFGGGDVDARADIYSFGVIVYELLAGERPIEGDGVLVMVDRLLNAAPVPLADRRPDLPPGVADAVMRALAKPPQDRWETMAAFARALTETGVEETSRFVLDAQPRLLGTYELGPVIGEGRFGSRIHAGVHKALGHPVAIRAFRQSGRADGPAVRERFLKEARALQVAHRNIVQVRDFGEDGDLIYVVTDLLTGCSLADLLARERPLSLARVDAFVAQIADACAALHRRGGLICGLHPEIVRVVQDDEGERIAISSAGVCQIRDVLSTLDDETLRGRGARESELLYVAPELLMGQPATPRSDLYTIGVLGYELATGRTPYGAASLPELLGAVIAGPPPDPRTLRPDLPPRQAECLMRCLSREPGQRFESAAELLAAWTMAPRSGEE